MSTPEQPAVTRENLSDAEIKNHWPKGKPDAIIFASASLRKGLLLNLWLQWLTGTDPSESSIPGFVGAISLNCSDPILFQRSVEEQIRNGDGTAKEPVLIGHLYGVPIILEPQDGETKSNIAAKESANKIASVWKKYEGRDVVIFACDTVGEVELFDGKWERFGKPANEPDFSYRIEALGQEVWELFYLWEHSWRADGKPVKQKHTNALVMERLSKKGDQATYTTNLELELPHDFERIFRSLQVFLESGGGGLFQQFIDWSADVLDQISDEEMKKVLAQLPETQRTWYLMMNIMGLQAWQLLPALSGATGLVYTEKQVATESS